ALEGLSGFERSPVKPGANPFQRGADRERFAEFYAELDAHEEIATRMDAVCVAPIAYTGQAELARDIDNFKAALDGVKVEEAFLPVAAPGASSRTAGTNIPAATMNACAPSAQRCAGNTR